MLIFEGEQAYASDPLPLRFQRLERAQDSTGGSSWAFWWWVKDKGASELGATLGTPGLGQESGRAAGPRMRWRDVCAAPSCPALKSAVCGACRGPTT